MTDELAAAPAASEPTSVPEAIEAVEAPSEVVEAEPTARGAIDRAFNLVDIQENENAKPAEVDAAVKAPTDERARGTDGKFVVKEAKAPAEPEAANPEVGEEVPAVAPEPGGFTEAPTRFSADAKAAWKDAPDSIKAETHRMMSELEGGIDKYRGDAEQWAGLSEFDQLAKSNNTDVKTALGNYVAADRILNQDPIRGLDHVAQMYGTSLREIAEKVLGQTPDQTQGQNDQTIRELRGQISEMQSQVGSVSKAMQSQREQAIMNEINEFAQTAPRFDELSGEVEIQLRAGFDLKTAYGRAERLNPLPPAPAAVAAQLEPAAQPRKGSLSVTGAPSPGSNPTTRKPPSSPQSALDTAFAELGID